MKRKKELSEILERIRFIVVMSITFTLGLMVIMMSYHKASGYGINYIPYIMSGVFLVVMAIIIYPLFKLQIIAKRFEREDSSKKCELKGSRMESMTIGQLLSLGDDDLACIYSPKIRYSLTLSLDRSSVELVPLKDEFTGAEIREMLTKRKAQLENVVEKIEFPQKPKIYEAMEKFLVPVNLRIICAA